MKHKKLVKQDPVLAAKGTDTLWLVVVGVLACLVRALFAIESQGDPFRGLLFLDARVYHLLATEIAEKTFWGSEVFFRAPLFPYLLGIVYKLFGSGHSAIEYLNSLLGIGTAIMTYLIADIHFGRRIARIAGICAAVYPTLYFFELSLMPTALEVCTFTAAVYFLSRYERDRLPSHLVYSGIALACAALSRPTILSFVLVLPVWLKLIDQRANLRDLLRRFGLILLPMALLILPVTIRNYVIEPKLVLISSQGGANFYIGNNEAADGQTVAFPFGQTPLNKFEDHIWSASTFLAERSTHRKLTASEVSSFWLNRGLNFVTAHPGDALGLFLKKLYLLFCGEELFNNSNPLAPREYTTVYAVSLWRKLINFPFGLVAPLFLVGAAILLRKRESGNLLLLFIGVQAATLSFFFISSRFRQPLLPVMIIVAVFAAGQLYQWLRSAQWRRLLAYGSSLILLVAILNPPTVLASRQNRSMYFALLGGALAAQERYPEAVDQLRESIKIADDNPTAFQLLGSLYVKSGQVEQALAVLHRAEELAPDAIQTQSLLARIYYDLHDYETALRYFEKVIAAGATIERFQFWAARSALETNQMESAREHIAAALKESPDDSLTIDLERKISEAGNNIQDNSR